MTAVVGIDIRRPVPPDRKRIEEMWDRCSAETRFCRLHSPSPTLPRSYLKTVIADPDGSRIALAAGAVVGLASLIETGQGWADLGVVVEDSWQRQGIGTRLVRELLSCACTRRICCVKAEVLASNAQALGPLRRLEGKFRLTSLGRTIEATVQLKHHEHQPADADFADHRSTEPR
jgi:ribosomal protein S18 acetylase RimI-like enzyme